MCPRTVIPCRDGHDDDQEDRSSGPPLRRPRPEDLHRPETIFQGDFTREQVLGKGYGYLTRSPGFGPAGVREAIDWARSLEAAPVISNSELQLQALIEMARDSDQPVEALTAIVRLAWSSMTKTQRNDMDEGARAAVKAIDAEPGTAPRM